MLESSQGGYINGDQYPNMKNAQILEVNSAHSTLSRENLASQEKKGYININQYPGMIGQEVLQINPDSLTGTQEEIDHSPPKKKSRTLLKTVILGTGLTVVAGIGLFNSCDTAKPTPEIIVPPTPTSEPTLMPSVEPTNTPEATQTPFSSPTPLVLEIPTSTPLFDYETYSWGEEVLAAGDFRWKAIENNVLKNYPDMKNRPNLKNDLTTAATELSLAHEGVLPSEAYSEQIGSTFSIPKKDILDIERACLEGKPIPIAPDYSSQICTEVFTTSGANLDENNNKKDKAYKAAERLDRIFETIFQREFEK